MLHELNMAKSTNKQSTTKKNYGEGEVKNVYGIFKWIYVVTFHLGCLGFRICGEALQVPRWGWLYTNIVRMALVGGFIGSLALKVIDKQSATAMFGHLSPVLKFILSFECVNSTLMYMQASIMMDVQKHAHLRLTTRLQQLDKSMCVDFPGVSWNYGKSVRKYTSLSLSVFVFYYVVSLIYLFNLANCNCDLLTSFLLAVTYASMTAAPGTVGFLHIGMMDLLRIRYRLIQRMVEQESTTTRVLRDGGGHCRQSRHLRLGRLCSFCQHYTELIPFINDVFGYVCAAGIFYDFAILTNMGFLLCQKASAKKRAPPKDYVFILLCMVPRIYKVIMTACYGYLADKEKKNCMHAISAAYANCSPFSAQVRDTLHYFMHWKIHHNYHLTIGKMIRCNLIVAFMVFHGIVNYVIILIQLQFQQNSIQNQLKNYEMPNDVEVIHHAKFPNI